jgi:hypothetical protein
LRWHFYLTILLGYTLDLSGGAGWVTMMMDVNCSKGEDIPSTAQTNKQTNKQTNQQSFCLLFSLWVWLWAFFFHQVTNHHHHVNSSHQFQ